MKHLDEITREAYASFDSLVRQCAEADEEENRERVLSIIRKMTTDILERTIERLQLREQEGRENASFQPGWRDKQKCIYEADGLKEAIEELEHLKDENEYEDN